MLRHRSQARGGSSVLLRGILCLYVLAAVMLPLAHHDFACHLKSATHCTTCVAGASSAVASFGAPSTPAGLDDAGCVASLSSAAALDPLAGTSSGRSPPAR